LMMLSMFIRDHLFLPIAPVDDARVMSMAFPAWLC